MVFLGALGEGLFFFNLYFPGSIIIVLGVALAAKNGLSAVVAVVGLVIFGFFLTTIVNYLLGRYGWYRIFLKLGLAKQLEQMKRRLEHYGLPMIFSTYIHPNIGALTATSAGILTIPFRPFLIYSAAALILWNTLWGVIVYFFGSVLLELLGTKIAVFLLGAWIIYAAIKFVKEKKREKQPLVIP